MPGTTAPLDIEAKGFYDAASEEASAKVEAADTERLANEKRLQETKEQLDSLEVRLAGVSNELNNCERIPHPRR